MTVIPKDKLCCCLLINIKPSVVFPASIFGHSWILWVWNKNLADPESYLCCLNVYYSKKVFFVLSLLLLHCKITQISEFIHCGEGEHKCVLFTAQIAIMTLANLLKTLTEFSYFVFGLQVNIYKSQAYLFPDPMWMLLKVVMIFIRISYLGFFLSSDLLSLYKVNTPPPQYLKRLQMISHGGPCLLVFQNVFSKVELATKIIIFLGTFSILLRMKEMNTFEYISWCFGVPCVCALCGGKKNICWIRGRC